MIRKNNEARYRIQQPKRNVHERSFVIRRLLSEDAVQQLIFFRALVEERCYRLSPVRKKQIVIPTVYPRASEGRSEGILRFVVKSPVSKTLSQALFL
jgi:hypothetical protein